MSIIQNQIEEGLKIGATLLRLSSVYNYHVHGIPDSPNSNLQKSLSEIFVNLNVKKVVVLVGSIGRSGHSATSLNIFDVSNCDDEQIADFSMCSNTSKWESYERIDKFHVYYQETGRIYF